jgi:hypothetical protein
MTRDQLFKVIKLVLIHCAVYEDFALFKLRFTTFLARVSYLIVLSLDSC